MKLGVLLFPVLLSAAAPPFPSGEPAPPPYADPRIRTVIYSAQEVVPIAVASGYQLTVELGRSERIENIAIGDSDSWLVTPNKRGDFLFIKPLAGAQTTNLTVITEARTYLFELSAGGAASPYTLRFQYEVPEAQDSQTAATRAPGKYRLSGSRAIKPTEILDDGAKTYVLLKPDQELPAIFSVNRDGSERLVNGAMREGRYVIDGVANRLVLRLDKQSVTASRKPRLKD